MTDLERILPLWHELESTGVDSVLATVVGVEGSSYRKPGARMLLAQDGRRAGTVSGGCLEAEVARRAWWLTANGPVVERYSTLDDDGDMPYGSGCGGAVFLLLERGAMGGSLLAGLEAAFQARMPAAIATVLDGPHAGRHVFAHSAEGGDARLADLAARALDTQANFEQTITLEGMRTRVFAEYCPARPGLWIFGAGDDAKPLLTLARELGWFVAVMDGRSNLATRERFSSADDVRVLQFSALPAGAAEDLAPKPTDAAVVMTHSFEQDSRILASLLQLAMPPAYIGVLGPQRRTRELLAEAARLLNLSATSDRIDRWLAHLHAPTGLDLGADTPASIALSILAEAQQVLHAGSGRALREVRAAKGIAALL
ncbi:MAG TPA: XdhC family protein [Terracidiphilus sp.]|nr:XdhC family protein [Terracidiphilus sp.]